MTSRAEEAMRSGFEIDLTMFEEKIVPRVLLPQLQTLQDRQMRDGDILLATYPKSGTHWVWEILNMIVAGKAEYAKHWQMCSWLEYREQTDLDELDSPRIFFSHLVPRLLPRDLWRRKCHVINLKRNPKDAIVSVYMQQKHQNYMDKSKPAAFSGTFDQMVEAYIKGTVTRDCMFDYLLDWEQFPLDYPDVPFLALNYEDLIENDVREVKKMAEFLGRPLADEVYESIAEACRFEKLKHASEHIKDPTFYNRWNKGGYFRKGIIGDWKNWFSTALSERLERTYEEKMRRPYPYN